MNPIYNAFKTVTIDRLDGPSDEEFQEDFLEWPNVFEATHADLLRQAFILTDQIWFSVDETDITIFQGSNRFGSFHNRAYGWQLKLRSGEKKIFDSLATLVNQIYTKEAFQFPIIPGFCYSYNHSYFYRGLLSKPSGTYLFYCRDAHESNRHISVIVNTNIGLKQFEVPFKNFKSLQNLHHEIKEHIGAILFKYREPIDITEDHLIPWNSSLDLTFFHDLKPASREKILSQIDVNQLKDIEEITTYTRYNINRFIDNTRRLVDCHLDLILFLAKNEKTKITIKIFTETGYNGYVRFSEIKEHLEKIHLELKGEQLEHALNLYFEILPHHTFAGDKELPTPPVNEIKQHFFDNKEYDPDLKVQMRDSEEVIHVHRIELALFSEVFKPMLFGKFNESPSGTTSFPDYSDEVVRQMLRCIYGFKPNFEKCPIVDLLKLANTHFSPLFMNSATNHLEKLIKEEQVKVSDLVQIVGFNLWISLHEDTAFFKYLSKHWREVIDAVPKNKQKTFREEFFSDWLNFINPNNEQHIKV